MIAARARAADGVEVAAPSSRLAYRPFGWLRLALALTVALYHAPLAWAPAWASLCGPVAVFVFFALSGFIITEAAVAIYAGRPAAFLANRFARLYPPYLIALALAIAASTLPGLRESLPAGATGWRNLVANVAGALPVATPLQRLLGMPGRHEFVSIIWAVRVEFAFYFVVFALLALGRRLTRRARRAAIAATMALALALHVAAFYMSAFAGPLDSILSYAPLFVAGAAWYLIEGESEPAARGFLAGAIAVSLPLAALRAAVYPLNDLRGGVAAALARTDPAVATGVLAMLAAGLALAVLASRRDPAPSSIPLDRRAGDLTYPIYVVHAVPMALAAQYGANAPGAGTLAALVAVVALAWLIDLAMKRAVDPLRDRLRGRPVPGAMAT